MIYPCNYEDFRDIIFSAICGPIPKVVTIFLTNKPAAEKLEKIISDLTNEKPKRWDDKDFFHSSFVTENGARISIYQREESSRLTRGFTCGFRTNDVIVDQDYSLADFYEIYMPMCSLGGATYSIDSHYICSYFETEHKKGMDEIEYWKKVRKENDNKKSN